MLTEEGKKKIVKTIVWGCTIGFIFVLIVYVFTGSFQSTYAVVIVILLAILRFVIPDYIVHRRRRSNKFK